jgi:hypothetical protein
MAESASHRIKTQLNVIGPPVEGGGRGELDEQVTKLHNGAKDLITGVLDAIVALGHGDTKAIEALRKTLQNAEDTNQQAMRSSDARH